MSYPVETRGLRFSYGSQAVLAGIDLKVAPGSFYALLGRNGIGKTTLLKILVGLLDPAGGSASILGRDSRSLHRDDWLSIGYMSEGQKIYDWLTGEELIAFTQELYPNWDHAFCRHLKQQMQLPLRQKVRRYSKGERMKLILLLAMAFHPRVLLLDEPFAGLDVLAKEQLISCLLDTTQQEQWAVLFTSHDLADVERLADDIGLIEGGKLKISEPLESLQNRFRRIEAFGVETLPSRAASIWQPQMKNGALTFIETAFSDLRQRELLQRWGDQTEITPMALREIVLAFLTEASDAHTP
jgi:ABC-2 type transport system ATP-binding protein